MNLNRSNYFSRKANTEYMSVSQWKAFNKCEAAALAEIKGKYKREETTALLVGQYADAHFDGTVDAFMADHPDMFKKDGTLKAEFIQANEIINRIEKDKLMMKYLSGEKQVIMTGKIKGVPVKIMMDSYHPNKMIVDRKIMKDFAMVGMLPWFEAWEYDVQGAVYQEIVRQNIGKKIPFYLAAATKQKITDIDIIHLSQSNLDFALEQFCEKVEKFDAIKKGVIKPDRCEQCDWCKVTKKIKVPTESDEFYL